MKRVCHTTPLCIRPRWRHHHTTSRHVGGTGGTRTPVLVTGLVYSQMRSPLRHSPTWDSNPFAGVPAFYHLLSYPTQPPERNISRVGVNVGLPVGHAGRLWLALLPVTVAAVLLAPGDGAVLSPHQVLSGCHARSRASSGSSVGKVSRRSESSSAILDTCSAGVGGGGPDDSITVG